MISGSQVPKGNSSFQLLVFREVNSNDGTSPKWLTILSIQLIFMRGFKLGRQKTSPVKKFRNI